jgi:hypothetical protein
MSHYDDIREQYFNRLELQDEIDHVKEDVVNHPKHYTTHPSGVECIEITEHLNFCVGNAIKYLWRCDNKHNSPLEDLKKARWYIDREIKRLESLND